MYTVDVSSTSLSAAHWLAERRQLASHPPPRSPSSQGSESVSVVVQSEAEVSSSSDAICCARMYLYTSARGKQEGLLTHGLVQLAFANDTCSHQHSASVCMPVCLCVCMCVWLVLLHASIKY